MYGVVPAPELKPGRINPQSGSDESLSLGHLGRRVRLKNLD